MPGPLGFRLLSLLNNPLLCVIKTSFLTYLFFPLYLAFLFFTISCILGDNLFKVKAVVGSGAHGKVFTANRLNENEPTVTISGTVALKVYHLCV